MRKALCLGVLLGLLGCDRTGIKGAVVDASPEVARPTGDAASDSGGTAVEAGGPSVGLDTAAMAFPDTGTDRLPDQAVSSGDTGTDRLPDQAVSSGDTGTDRLPDQALASDGSQGGLDLRPEVRVVPGNAPNGYYELRDDSPWTPAPDAGQCVPGGIRTYGFEFPTGAQTVKVRPASSIKNFIMDGTLSDGSGPVLRYDLTDPTGQQAGDLLVWRQDSTWFVQLTVYGSRADSGCVHGELVFKGTL